MMDDAGLFIRVMGALAFIVGLLLLGLYGIRQWGSRLQSRKPDLIQVKSVKMLLPKRYLLVVQVAGKDLILGATDNEITLLGSLDEGGRDKEALG